MGDRLSLIKERWRLLMVKKERERREIEKELMLEDYKDLLKREQESKDLLKREQESKEASAASGGSENNG